ncbi:hypothetical protein LNN38_00545 [Pseudomonas sp. LA21]|uniref:hypothetical protein n=1 Tax=unclassified Pseudomonas TaxID=196821 RepID=UPI001FB7B7E7|nr:hypothetical protein [Pseudomonas sp. LA21]MCJ1883327.1 hypothetical protein [Pseudomonas sp. LA21]
MKLRWKFIRNKKSHNEMNTIGDMSEGRIKLQSGLIITRETLFSGTPAGGAYLRNCAGLPAYIGSR